ncbi:hypothetical protein PILCRDRAFT_812260, partial [Piloderma croceum F 1598]
MTLLQSCKLIPHFELSPALVLLPLKVSPYPGRVVVFGIPPFLERRAVTTICPLNELSTDLQQGRPRVAITPRIVRRMNTAVFAHTQALSDTPYPPSSPSTPCAGTTTSHSSPDF